jgi:hypothetical protein
MRPVSNIGSEKGSEFDLKILTQLLICESNELTETGIPNILEGRIFQERHSS